MQNKHLYALFAIISVPLSGLNIDIYVPSLPAVTHYFNVQQHLVQLTITTYMLGYGLMLLFSGNVCDSVGRRKPFVIALMAYLFITLAIPHSQSIYQLLMLRFLQGITIAFILVPMRAILSDLFEGEEFYKYMNYNTMMWSLGPIIAPAIGGYLQHYFNWQANFYALAAYAFFLLVGTFIIIPETIKQKTPLNFAYIKACYKELLTHKKYILSLCCLGQLFSYLVLFGVVCPFLTQDVMHYTPVQFGYVALLMGLAWFLGNMGNRFIIHIPMAKKIRVCVWITLLDSIIMVILALTVGLNIYAILIPAFILLVAGGMTFPNYSARSISFFRHIAGSANGLMGALMVLLASGSSAFGTLLKSQTQLPLMLTYFALSVFGVIAFYWSGFAIEKQK